MSHGTSETRIANLREFNEMRLIAECHSKAFRYPVIKAWFLDKYPEVKNFGMKVEAQEQEETEAEDNIVEIPAQEQEEAIPA